MGLFGSKPAKVAMAGEPFEIGKLRRTSRRSMIRAVCRMEQLLMKLAKPIPPESAEEAQAGFDRYRRLLMAAGCNAPSTLEGLAKLKAELTADDPKTEG